MLLILIKESSEIIMKIESASFSIFSSLNQERMKTGLDAASLVSMMAMEVLDELISSETLFINTSSESHPSLGIQKKL